ncbi:hypothetical protein [Nannocystis pusilla]|uniref:hypothetical protein n=1 Tax=Nannocystis pusilla TaxID=889268 RepID=UPI003B794D7C
MSTLEAFLPLFEPESLAKIASKKAYAAGVELFEAKAVSDIVFAGNCLKGKVKGSHPQPHATTINCSSLAPSRRRATARRTLTAGRRSATTRSRWGSRCASSTRPAARSR